MQLRLERVREQDLQMPHSQSWPQMNQPSQSMSIKRHETIVIDDSDDEDDTPIPPIQPISQPQLFSAEPVSSAEEAYQPTPSETSQLTCRFIREKFRIPATGRAKLALSCKGKQLTRRRLSIEVYEAERNYPQGNSSRRESVELESYPLTMELEPRANY
jgi:hypothetical protein